MINPSVITSLPDVEAAERAIRKAIDDRDPNAVHLIGHGELSIALKWTEGDHEWVVKRVPPFNSRANADEYVELTRGYIDSLDAIGVKCVRTELLDFDRSDGTVVVYHVQPLLHIPDLVDHRMKQRTPGTDCAELVAILDHVFLSVRDHAIPLDAQVANWYWYEGEVWQLDLTTPLTMDSERKNVKFKPDGFLKEYPVPFRHLVYKELMKVAHKYYDAPWVVQDVMTQLIRQGLDAWLPVVQEIVRERHGVDVDPALARKQFSEDEKFYPTLLRVKRLQRAWMQRTGRRYDSLLPAVTSFGR